MAGSRKRRAIWDWLVPLMIGIGLVGPVLIVGWWKVNQVIRTVRGPTEEELKTQLIESGRLAQLEAWAMPKIGQPLAALQGEGQPPESDVGRVADARPITSEAGTIQYFRMEMGGGFRHRGLLVGNEPEVHMFPERYSNRWSENVVYYDEIPQK